MYHMYDLPWAVLDLMDQPHFGRKASASARLPHYLPIRNLAGRPCQGIITQIGGTTKTFSRNLFHLALGAYFPVTGAKSMDHQNNGFLLFPPFLDTLCLIYCCR